jgi:hypothetical protein
LRVVASVFALHFPQYRGLRQPGQTPIFVFVCIAIETGNTYPDAKNKSHLWYVEVLEEKNYET